MKLNMLCYHNKFKWNRIIKQHPSVAQIKPNETASHLHDKQASEDTSDYSLSLLVYEGLVNSCQPYSSQEPSEMSVVVDVGAEGGEDEDEEEQEEEHAEEGAPQTIPHQF